MIRLEIQVSTFSLVQLVTVSVSITTAVLCIYAGSAVYSDALKILSIVTGSLLVLQSASLLSTALLMINNKSTLLVANGIPFLGTTVTGLVWFCIRITVSRTQSPPIEIVCLLFWILTEITIGMTLVFSVMKFQLLETADKKSYCVSSNNIYTHSQNSSLGDSTMFEHTPFHKHSTSGCDSVGNNITDALPNLASGGTPIKNIFTTPKLKSLKPSFKARHQSDNTVGHIKEKQLRHVPTTSSLKLYQLMNDQSSTLLPLPILTKKKFGEETSSSPNSPLSKFTKFFNSNSNNNSNTTLTNSSPRLLFPQPQIPLKVPSPQGFDNWDINTSIHSKLFLPSTPFSSISPGSNKDVRDNHSSDSYFPKMDNSSFLSSSSNQFNNLLDHAGFARNHTPNPATFTNTVSEDELEYEEEYASPYYTHYQESTVYSPQSDFDNSSNDSMLLLPHFSFAGTQERLHRLSVSGSDTSCSILASPIEPLSFGQYDKEKIIRDISFNTAPPIIEAA